MVVKLALGGHETKVTNQACIFMILYHEVIHVELKQIFRHRHRRRCLNEAVVLWQQHYLSQRVKAFYNL